SCSKSPATRRTVRTTVRQRDWVMVTGSYAMAYGLRYLDRSADQIRHRAPDSSTLGRMEFLRTTGCPTSFSATVQSGRQSDRARVRQTQRVHARRTAAQL